MSVRVDLCVRACSVYTCVLMDACSHLNAFDSMRGCAMDAVLIRLSLCAVLPPGVRSTPAPAETKLNVLAIVLGLVGAAIGVGLFVAGYIYWKGKSSTSGKSGEFQTLTYLSRGADSASPSVMQSPAAAPSESVRNESSYGSPTTPHPAIPTPSATPAGGTLQMGSDSTPSVPASTLTLNMQRPPQTSDWMEATTPPGTPPGEPPEPYVSGELVFVENLNTTNQAAMATLGMMPRQRQAHRDAGVGLPQASGGPARDMRRSLEDADKGQSLLNVDLQDEAPMNMPLLYSSNQLPQVKTTQQESQLPEVKRTTEEREEPSSDVPAAGPYSRRDSQGGVSMMAPHPPVQFSKNLFESTQPSSQESAASWQESLHATARPKDADGAVEI